MSAENESSFGAPGREGAQKGLSVHGGPESTNNFSVLPNGSLRFSGGIHPTDAVFGIRRGEQVRGIRRKIRNSGQGR
jgi:hypothetical protein